MSMTEVFADTSGWANYFIHSEPFYQTATRLMRQWQHEGTRVVTTNYVLAELAALFISPLRVPRPQQIQVIETICAASWIELVHIDQTRHNRAWQVFKQYDDKMWSLVDCSSLAVMQERGITQGFTTDHHFEQAGFLRLLR